MLNPTDAGVSFAAPDVTVLIDDDGIIRKVDFGDLLGLEDRTTWVGRSWVSTMDLDSRNDGGNLIREARERGASQHRSVVQQLPSGLELPVEYKAVRLGGAAGTIAIGRSLQAVSAIRAEYASSQRRQEAALWQNRGIGTLYRALFDRNTEPVVVLRADNLLISEANPASQRQYGFLPGQNFLERVAPRDRAPLSATLDRVRREGQSPGIMVRMDDRVSWIVRATLAEEHPAPNLLLQMTRTVNTRRDVARAEMDVLPDLLDRLPAAFLLLDSQGAVRRANATFMDMVEAESPLVIGTPIERWLTSPGFDQDSLLQTLRRDRIVRGFRTLLAGKAGVTAAVELSAVGDSDVNPSWFAVLLQPERAPVVPSPLLHELGANLSAIAAHLGQTALPQLVKDSRETIERYYIQSALALVNGNRSLAAELLGMSRQNLHLKLNRYKLHGIAITATYE